MPPTLKGNLIPTNLRYTWIIPKAFPMTANLDLEQRKALHSADYVARFQQKAPTRIRKLIDRMIINGLDVVDFGCGDAVIIEYLKESVGSYKGVDFSEEFIEVAKGKIIR